MSKRGPHTANHTIDLNYILVCRIALAEILNNKYGSVQAQNKLMLFGELCNADVSGQSITDRTARTYLSCNKNNKIAPWRFRRIRKNEVLSTMGFDKAAHPSLLEKIGYGPDRRSAGQGFKGYAPPFISIGGQLKLRVQGSKARILEKDNLPDAHGNRTAGPFRRVDVRVERCEIYTEDNSTYDQARNYVRITYPDDSGVGKSDPGVVNLMYVASEQRFALVATIRPAVRKICVEAIRGFPDQTDKSITVNGKPLTSAMFAALREASEEGGVMLKSDDGRLAIESMKENYADTGKLADVVAFFVSSFETLGDAWKAAEPWQLGIVLVDPIEFLVTCAAGGGEITADHFEFRSRFSDEAKDIYNPSTIRIQDMFTLLAGNLAIQKLAVSLSDSPSFSKLGDQVRARFKR